MHHVIKYLVRRKDGGDVKSLDYGTALSRGLKRQDLLIGHLADQSQQWACPHCGKLNHKVIAGLLDETTQMAYELINCNACDQLLVDCCGTCRHYTGTRTPIGGMLSPFEDACHVNPAKLMRTKHTPPRPVITGSISGGGRGLFSRSSFEGEISTHTPKDPFKGQGERPVVNHYDAPCSCFELDPSVEKFRKEPIPQYKWGRNVGDIVPSPCKPKKGCPDCLYYDGRPRCMAQQETEWGPCSAFKEKENGKESQ